MKLLDLLRAYPGGVAALSESSGVSANVIYRLTQRRRRPVQEMSDLATTLRDANVRVEGKRVTEARLWAAWEDERE